MRQTDTYFSPTLIRKLAYSILLLFALRYVVRGYREQAATLNSLDFKTVYGGTRCLLHHCDPYDSVDVYQAYLDAGGPTGQDERAFRPHEQLYMPSALAMLTPFALLRWGPAHLLWLAFSTGIYLCGVTLIARLCFEMELLASAMGIAMLLMSNTILIDLAQPAQLTIGLSAIAVWCIVERRYLGIGVMCFAVALAFKPHVCGPIWIYFVLCKGEYRRLAIRIFFVTLLVCAPGMIWASVMPESAHWLSEVRENMAVLSIHGMINDPGPTNVDSPLMGGLQSILSLVWDNARFFNGVAWAVSLVLVVIWYVATFRMRPSKERDYLAIATICLISLMPIYHRNYDMGLLIMVFPAFALLWARGGLWMRMAAAGITYFTVAEVSDGHGNFTVQVLPYLQKPLSLWNMIFWNRPVAFSTALLMIFYVGCQYAWMVRERRVALIQE